MKIIIILAITGLIASTGLTACSSGTTSTSNTANIAAKNSTVANNGVAANTAPAEKPGEETPASVKAAFPDAQSFTKQHKDITKDQIADIEKEAGGKLPDTDHHSYLAFSMTGGTRKQIGAATIVEAKGKEIVVVYENKEGKPYIKELRTEGIAADFLKQFAGKGHDDKFQIGGDIKANGVDDATAKAIAQAVRIDILTMQTLYGAADSH